VREFDVTPHRFRGPALNSDRVQHRLNGKPARAASHTTVFANSVPNHLLVNDPSPSIHGTGGNVGKYDAYGITFASVTRYGNRASNAWFMPPSSPL
jgi:hypothetical protein